MFSPEASATAARNPRRRVRAAVSDESLAQNVRSSNKRRKRSSLAPDTFEPSGGNRAANNATSANGHAKLPNGHGAHYKEKSPELWNADGGPHTLPNRARGSRRAEVRGAGRELGLLQAETDHYSVWKDSDLPSNLQSVLGRESWRAGLVPQLGYAIALTHTQAIIWPYTRDGSFSDGSRTLSVKLPFQSAPSRYSKDPLPLFALVYDAGVGELALLVVLPSSGKLVYWESVTNAAKTDTVRQRQQGLHGAVSGLFSSEVIQEITEAEPDGFLITTSYGRIVHLSVRDLQGRPHLSSSILQHEDAAASGFLGSLRHVFGGWRKEITAAHAMPMQTKSSRRCVIADANGTLETWELTRHGSKSLLSVVDARDTIQSAISTIHNDRAEHRNDLRIYDFAISSRGAERRKQQSQHNIMLLCGYTTGSESFYYLVDAILGADTLEAGAVHPISRWARPTTSRTQDSRLRLILPEPEHTAFVISDESIVLVSIKTVEETPDTQLQLESHTLSEPFQDVLTLNAKRGYRIMACAVRPRERNSDKTTCHLLVDSFGLARVSTTPAVESETVQERRSYLCQSQIEQGVFFGSIPDNILEFSSNLQKDLWTDTEIEQATLAINDSIVSNNSRRIPPIGPSMEQQIQTRAQWLKQLLVYVGKSRLSASVRWHMMWSAEKIAAAEAIWSSYSGFLRTKNLREKLLLPELLDIMKESLKHENRPEFGETDIVRHYLLNDVARIEVLVPYAEFALEELYREDVVKKSSQEARLIQQAVELQMEILRAAYQFRTKNGVSYGFPEGSFQDGLYQGDYSRLPYFWTSPEESPGRIKTLVEQAFDFATAANAVTSPIEGDDVDLTDLANILASIPGLIGLCCRVYEERYRWIKAQTGAIDSLKAEEFYEEYCITRRTLIVRLLEVELDQDAFALGEQYGDVKALAELLAHSNRLNMQLLQDPSTSEEDYERSNQKLEQNEERMDRFFQLYGDDWAEATFSLDIHNGEASNILLHPAKHRQYLDRFLAKHHRLNKLRWMHAVSTGDYNMGAQILTENGHEEESLWPHKVNLSIAKLCKLAAQEQKQVDQAEALKFSDQLDRELAVSDIQEQIFAFTRPVLRNAIDELAEVDLALDSYGGFVKNQPYLGGVLRANFEKLIQNRCLDKEELLDMLTLMAPSGQEADDEVFMHWRFVLALRLLSLAGFNEARTHLHLANIWRRCLLQDNWAKLNRTENMTDEKVAKLTEGTVFFQTLFTAHREGLLKIYVPIPPAQLIGAGTTVELLRASEQYKNAADDLVEALAADLQTEDKRLEKVMAKGRLELWWPGVVEAAKVAAEKRAESSGNVYDKGIENADRDVVMEA